MDAGGRAGASPRPSAYRYVWPRIDPLSPIAASCLSYGSTCSDSSAALSSLLARSDLASHRSFREMIGYGDMVTAALALIALIALRARGSRAIWFVRVFVVVAL